MYRRTMTRWSPPGPGLACLGGVAIQWSKSASLPAPRHSRLSLSLSLCRLKHPAAFARNLQGAGEQSAAGVVKWAWFFAPKPPPGAVRGERKVAVFFQIGANACNVAPVRPTTRANLLLARDDSDISPCLRSALILWPAVGHNCRWPPTAGHTDESCNNVRRGWRGTMVPLKTQRGI